MPYEGPKLCPLFCNGCSAPGPRFSIRGFGSIRVRRGRCLCAIKCFFGDGKCVEGRLRRKSHRNSKYHMKHCEVLIPEFMGLYKSLSLNIIKCLPFGNNSILFSSILIKAELLISENKIDGFYGLLSIIKIFDGSIFRRHIPFECSSSKAKAISYIKYSFLVKLPDLVKKWYRVLHQDICTLKMVDGTYKHKGNKLQ